jgi:excisionase family DNA binding protein
MVSSVTSLRRGLVLGAVSAVSLVSGAALIAIGAITRQQRAVAAGKRRFHGHGFERRWISDQQERERHAVIVADRLDLDVELPGAVSVADAAERLGVSVSTVRRRAKSGQLKGAYRGGRLTGVVLGED